MRFTRTTTEPVHKDAVPLLDAHIARLREAHARFSEMYPGQRATWPGDDTIWETIRKELDATKNGDWRIRVVLHPETGIEVQVVAAPLGLSGSRKRRRADFRSVLFRAGIGQAGKAAASHFRYRAI